MVGGMACVTRGLFFFTGTFGFCRQSLRGTSYGVKGNIVCGVFISLLSMSLSSRAEAGETGVMGPGMQQHMRIMGGLFILVCSGFSIKARVILRFETPS